MRILDKCNSIDEIVKLILSKARYQKVVLCIDETSDVEFIDDVINRIGNDVVLLKYYYNKKNVSAFHNMVNNGARIVIYNVDLKHFYKLNVDNNYILNIFIPQSNFMLPYLRYNESVYGDNLLICDIAKRDYTTLLFLYELALNQTWNALLQNVDVDTTIFKTLDAIANNNTNFYTGLLNQVIKLKTNITDEYNEIEESQLPYYIYLRLCATLKMLESLMQEREQYIDFYKTELSVEAVNKVYDLLIKYDVVQTLKFNCFNLIKLTGAILNRVKIIIKKYFNFNRINLNKLNNTIKIQSNKFNMDNLLYIAYIFNSI